MLRALRALHMQVAPEFSRTSSATADT